MRLPPAWQHFQAVLIKALDDGEPVDAVVRDVRAAAPDAAVEQWVASWEPPAVELASLLVRTWSIRDAVPPRP